MTEVEHICLFVYLFTKYCNPRAEQSEQDYKNSQGTNKYQHIRIQMNKNTLRKKCDVCTETMKAAWGNKDHSKSSVVQN